VITKEDVEQALETHDRQSDAAESLGISVRHMMRLRNEGEPVKVTLKVSSKVGKSLAEFKATYDKDTIVPQKIRDALEQLGEGWEYESAFAKLAGISMTDMGTYREQFADHLVYLRRDAKKVWAGTKKLVALVREMLP